MDDYRALVALADTGSVTAAADLLGTGQSQASRALARLAARLDTPLTQPAGRGVELTPAGRAIVRRVRPLLQELDDLEHGASHVPTAPLALVAHEPLSTFVLGLLDPAPLGATALRVVDAHPEAVSRAVLAGEAELGLATHPVPLRGVRVSLVVAWPLVVAARPALRSVSPAERPWVVPIARVAAGPVPAASLDGWPASAPGRVVTHEVTSLATALEVCARGAAAALLPRPVLAAHNRSAARGRQLVELPTSGARQLRQQVFLLEREGDAGDPATRQRVVDAVVGFASA